MPRKSRRAYKKLTGLKLVGVQDSSEPTLQVYYIPFTRKSRAGVVYTYYKKIIDKIKPKINVTGRKNTINKGNT